MTRFQAYQPFIGNIAAVIMDLFPHQEQYINVLKYRKEYEVSYILIYDFP